MSLEKYCCDGNLGVKPTICGYEKLKGGIKHAFVIQLDQTTITDWTSTSQWNAAIANGDVVLIQEIRGEYPEPSEIEGDRKIGCGNETELDGFDHVFNWEDRAVKEATNTFYENLNGCTFYFGWFDCQPNGTDRVWINETNEVSFVCKPANIEASVNTVQTYKCAAKWTSNANDFPAIYDAPANIFS